MLALAVVSWGTSAPLKSDTSVDPTGVVQFGEVGDVDWDALRAKLPLGSGDKQKRLKMFKDFDNGNGVLSLAEVDKATRDILQIDWVFDAKPAIMRAFQVAKNSRPSKRAAGDDYVELREFKFFFASLRQYLEYYVAFDQLDTDGDKKLSLKEFKAGEGKVETWVGKLDAEEEFKSMDSNTGGSVLFDEFSKWAIKKNLDLEDDDDFEAS